MSIDTENTAPLVVGSGEGQAVWFRANRIRVMATGATTGGGFSFSEVLAAPGDSPPLHIQHAEEESFYLLEGRMKFRLDDRIISAGPGTLVRIPAGAPHSFLVEGHTPARFLNLMVPGGGERLFLEAGRPAETEGLPPTDVTDFDVMRRVAAELHQEIVGPPLTPDVVAELEVGER
jgi:mannose-6-phosphate isomerase-like protein (cupin superfamily)